MLVVFFKSIITFIVVFVAVRLMGKRQLGEMQPFELVITLIIAEVACIPMNDPYIPFYSGIIPIFTLAFLEILLSTISRKSLLMRKFLSGSAVIVVDQNGINYESLKKLNINVNDLLEATRASGYADINEIAYAIFETNGKICVIEKEENEGEQALMPLTFIVDGKFEIENLKIAGVSKESVLQTLKKQGVNSLKSVLYMDVRQNGLVYLSQKKGGVVNFNMNVGGDW